MRCMVARREQREVVHGRGEVERAGVCEVLQSEGARCTELFAVHNGCSFAVPALLSWLLCVRWLLL